MSTLMKSARKFLFEIGGALPGFIALVLISVFVFGGILLVNWVLDNWGIF